jgi:sugar phosphate isomerase/epimerase
MRNGNDSERLVDRRGMPRRALLRAGGGLAALSLLRVPWALGGGREAAWRLKLALSSVMLSQLSLDVFCRRAAELGFKGIDLWGPFGTCRHLIEARELGADGWRRLLEKHQLEVAAYTTYRTKGHAEGFPAFAEFIGAAGGGLVVRESAYAKSSEEQLQKFFKALEPEIELARKHRVRLAIENHADAILDTLESIRLFVKLNPAPDVVGISLAIYHLQARKISIEEAIRACGKQLMFVYAWQQGRGLVQLPGHGPADFTPWLKTLAREGFGGWMTPFMHGEEPVEKMAAAVRKASQYLESAAEHSQKKERTDQP